VAALVLLPTAVLAVLVIQKPITQAQLHLTLIRSALVALTLAALVAPLHLAQCPYLVDLASRLAQDQPAALALAVPIMQPVALAALEQQLSRVAAAVMLLALAMVVMAATLLHRHQAAAVVALVEITALAQQAERAQLLKT
jgi:hypothetical protein